MRPNLRAGVDTAKQGPLVETLPERDVSKTSSSNESLDPDTYVRSQGIATFPLVGNSGPLQFAGRRTKQRMVVVTLVRNATANVVSYVLSSS